MEIILARNCKSLTGCLGKSYGCSITRRGKKFFTIRNPKGPRIKDGHLRFIFECARMAENNFLIADIDIRGEELLQAAREADVEIDSIEAEMHYDAQSVRDIKSKYGL